MGGQRTVRRTVSNNYGRCGDGTGLCRAGDSGGVSGTMVCVPERDATGVRGRAGGAPRVAVGMSGTGQVGVAVAAVSVASAVPVDAVPIATVGVRAGVVAVRKSAAIHPSWPCSSRTWRQLRPEACSCLPVGMSGEPSGTTRMISPPAPRRIATPWPSVPVTYSDGGVGVGVARTAAGDGPDGREAGGVLAGTSVGAGVVRTTGANVAGGVGIRGAGREDAQATETSATAASLTSSAQARPSSTLQRCGSRLDCAESGAVA